MQTSGSPSCVLVCLEMISFWSSEGPDVGRNKLGLSESSQLSSLCSVFQIKSCWIPGTLGVAGLSLLLISCWECSGGLWWAKARPTRPSWLRHTVADCLGVNMGVKETFSSRSQRASETLREQNHTHVGQQSSTTTSSSVPAEFRF